MTKVGREKGLISWESFTGQRQRAAGLPAEARPIRARTIAYSVIILVVSAVMLTAMVMRQPLRADVLHDRQPLYVTISGDRLRNGYVLKISNQTRRPQEIFLHAEAQPDMILAIAGDKDQQNSVTLTLTAAPDGQTSCHFTAALPAGRIEQASTDVTFVLSRAGESDIRVTDHFFAPERR
jgi:polyferredoxin